MEKGQNSRPIMEQDRQTGTQSPPVISSKVSNTRSCSGFSGATLEAGLLEGPREISRAGGMESRARGSLSIPLSILTHHLA